MVEGIKPEVDLCPQQSDYLLVFTKIQQRVHLFFWWQTSATILVSLKRGSFPFLRYVDKMVTVPMLNSQISNSSQVGFILGFYADTQGRKTRKSPLRSYASPLACLRASPKFCDYPTKLRKRQAARSSQRLWLVC